MSCAPARHLSGRICPFELFDFMKTVAWCYDAALSLAALAHLGGAVAASSREAVQRAKARRSNTTRRSS